MLTAIQAMGFSEAHARRALNQAHGMVDTAVELLLSGQIPLDEENNNSVPEPVSQEDNGLALPSVPSAKEETPEEKAAREKLEHERLVKQEAQRDLIDTLAENSDPDAMFDLDLREEQELLTTYRSLLIGRGKW